MIRQPSTCLCTTSTAPNRHHSRSSLFHGRRRAGLVEQPSALKPQQLKLMQERWSQEEQVSCCLSTLDIWLLLLCNVVLLHFDPSGPPKNQNLPSQIVTHYGQGLTSTRYPTRPELFFCYPNPTQTIFHNLRVQGFSQQAVSQQATSNLLTIILKFCCFLVVLTQNPLLVN